MTLIFKNLAASAHLPQCWHFEPGIPSGVLARVTAGWQTIECRPLPGRILAAGTSEEGKAPGRCEQAEA